MANGKTTAHSDAVLGVLRGTNLTAQATYYVALLVTNPSDDAMTGAVEASYAGYARPSLTAASGWNAISGTAPRQMTNNGTLNFGTKSDAGTVTVTGFAICKSAATAITTSGEALYWNSFTSKVINQNDPVTASAGSLVVSED